MSFIVLLLLLLTILAVFLKFKWSKQRYTKEGIPIIGNIPWIGCGIEFDSKGGYFLKDIWKKYGNIFQLYVGGKSLTFVLEESFYSTFYKAPEHEISFFDGIMDKESSFQLDLILGSLQETKEERMEYISMPPLRQMLQENNGHFTERFIQSHFDYLFEYSLKEQKKDPKSKEFTVNAFQLMTNLAAGIGANLLAGKEIASNEKLLKNIAKFQESGLKAITKPPLFNKGDVHASAVARKEICGVIKKAIQEEQKRGEYIETLLNLVYQSTGKEFSIDDTSHTIFVYLFATIANTNATATHLLVEILTDPVIKQRIENEIRDVIALHPSNVNQSDPTKYVITQKMIDQLLFLGNCLTETLRLYSPPIHVRKSNIDLTSQDGKILCRKNDIVCVSPWLRHRDERIYAKPDKFDPDRFMRPNKTKFSFLTFGQGRHFCLGKSFAESIIKFSIARLLLSYDLHLPHDQTSSHCLSPKLQWFSFGVVLPSVPVLVHFSPRNV